ncbi:MAG: c-type cytochrome [Gemmatimonadota bacterium]
MTGPAVALILAACGAPGAGQVGASADDPTEAPETSAVDAAPGAESPLTSEQRKILARAALPEGVDVALVEYGAEIFHGSGNCYICHGPDGRGVRGVGANLTDEEWWHSEGAHQDIMRTIMSGVAQADARNDWGAIMPARGGSTISDEEVRAAAAYVWSLRLLTTEPGAAGGA